MEDKILKNCIFCNIDKDVKGEVIFENLSCKYIELNHEVLQGSGIIITKRHVENVFSLDVFQWINIYLMIRKVKKYIDKKFCPDGYNIGWNVGEIGGQEIFHVHLHIIPRYADEPFAGKGIRYWLKQKENKRKNP